MINSQHIDTTKRKSKLKHVIMQDFRLNISYHRGILAMLFQSERDLNSYVCDVSNNSQRGKKNRKSSCYSFANNVFSDIAHIIVLGRVPRTLRRIWFPQRRFIILGKQCKRKDCS